MTTPLTDLYEQSYQSALDSEAILREAASRFPEGHPLHDQGLALADKYHELAESLTETDLFIFERVLLSNEFESYLTKLLLSTIDSFVEAL